MPPRICLGRGSRVAEAGRHTRPSTNLLSTAAPLTATESGSAPLDFTHLVIGGGLVGLAVAARLARRTGTRTAVLERHAVVCSETSGRNSEVVHAGLYYPPDALKTRLCIRGRALLWKLCTARSLPHARLGKWIVAYSPAQREAVHALAVHAAALGVPVRHLAAAHVAAAEPALRAPAAVLESPDSGIVDSHALAACLVADLADAGADLVLRTRVVAVRPRSTGYGWDVTAIVDGGDTATVAAEAVVNAAGLAAAEVRNMVSPCATPLWFAKGSYTSYAGPAPARRLIYPAPDPTAWTAGAGAGLGAHLTLDMAGRARFGPDLEWVASSHDLAVGPGPAAVRIRTVAQFLFPGLDAARLQPDYAGIRPKLRPDGGFADFVVAADPALAGWVDLLGIESPGLTSCLAIAEMVEQILYPSVRPT